MYTAGEDSGIGGYQPKGLGDVFQGGSAGGVFIRAGDVGADPPWDRPWEDSSTGIDGNYPFSVITK